MSFWTENRTNYILGLRVFIEGIEITKYLTGNVSIQYGSTGEFNTASLTIASPNDKFIITERNVNGQFYASEEEKRLLQVDRAFLDAKGAWDSNIGAPMFRYRDAIRIFERTHNNSNRWRHVFTGCVTQCTPSFSFDSGEKSLNFNCGDIREPIMGRKRFQSNKVYGEVKPEYIDKESTSLFEDMIYSTNQENTHVFAGMSLDDTISILLTGQYRVGKGLSFFQTTRGPASPLGKISRPFSFFTMNEAKDMEKIHSRIWGESLTYDEVTNIGKETRNDGKYSPFGENIVLDMVLPGGGLGIKHLTQFTLQQMGSNERTWETYLGMINSLCERIEYQFHIHPNGNIMFEPILYDHIPEYFPNYKECFIAKAQLKDNLNITPNPQSIVTSLIVTGGCANTNTPIDVGTVRQPRVAVYSKEMQHLYGINNEDMDFPFTADQNNLKLFASLEFQKRMMAATSLDFSIAWRPGLWLNRPMLVNDRYLGRIKTLGNEYTVGEDINLSIELDAVRFLDSKGVFMHISNEKSGLINWSGIFGKDDISDATQKTLFMDMLRKERKLTEKIE